MTKFPVLFLILIISLTEGQLLCEHHPNHKGKQNEKRKESLDNLRRSEMYYNGLRNLNQRSGSEDTNESWRDKILRAALILDDASELRGNLNNQNLRNMDAADNLSFQESIRSDLVKELLKQLNGA